MVYSNLRCLGDENDESARLQLAHEELHDDLHDVVALRARRFT
jgi:hypothetical protein